MKIKKTYKKSGPNELPAFFDEKAPDDCRRVIDELSAEQRAAIVSLIESSDVACRFVGADHPSSRPGVDYLDDGYATLLLAADQFRPVGCQRRDMLEWIRSLGSKSDEESLKSMKRGVRKIIRFLLDELDRSRNDMTLD